MKALVLHGPGGNYRFEPDWPMPKLMPGWVMIKVAYSGVCGSDLPRYSSTGSYHHPMILGHEFSGYVHAAPKSSRWKSGDPVAVLPIIPCGECSWCGKGEPFHCSRYQFIGSRNNGGHAEYCAVPENNLFLLPESVCIEEGSLIEPMLVALNTVRHSGFTPGKSAVVFGAGPIGLLIACWLRVFGATRIVISDIRRFSLDMARKCGFDELLNPIVQGTDIHKNIDFAFEAAGASKAIQSAISMLNVKGILTVVGRDTNDTIIPVQLFEQMMRKEITIKCCWGYKAQGEDAFLYQTLDKGRIPASRLISHRISVERSPEMITNMINREVDYCKVVIAFDENTGKDA